MYEVPSAIEFIPCESIYTAACGGSAYKVDGSEGRCWCSSEGARM